MIGIINKPRFDPSVYYRGKAVMYYPDRDGMGIHSLILVVTPDELTLIYPCPEDGDGIQEEYVDIDDMVEGRERIEELIPYNLPEEEDTSKQDILEAIGKAVSSPRMYKEHNLDEHTFQYASEDFDTITFLNLNTKTYLGTVKLDGRPLSTDIKRIVKSTRPTPKK
jgi:nucleoside-diphosphate-sugar epimerase